MPEISEQSLVRSIACGATAQLRELVDVADRHESRRFYAEMLRIAASLAVKHGFDFAMDRKFISEISNEKINS